MVVSIFLITLCAYGLAGFLWYRERTPNYAVALLAGQVATVLSPLWQALYGFVYASIWPALFTFTAANRIAVLARGPAYDLPWPVFLGGWLAVLPALIVFYLFQHRWWFPGYLTSLMTFILFVLYHLLLENMGIRRGYWLYLDNTTLAFGLQQTLLSAIMNGLVTLGVLAALLLTRRYSLASLLTILVPIPLALNLLVHGLLGAPLYTALLLDAQSWAGAIGLLGTLGLLASGAHIVAGSLERPRDWRQTI